MSRMAVVYYALTDAEIREVRRKIALLIATLKRCAAMQAELAKLEPGSGEDWAATLKRYRALEKASDVYASTDEYNRLYDALPEVERRLTADLATAKAQRLKLELAAATLRSAATTDAERAACDALAKGASTLYGDQLRAAQAEMAERVRAAIATPMDVATETGLSADQRALADGLLAAMPGYDTATNGLERLDGAQAAPSPQDRERAAQLSRIEPVLASLARLSAEAVAVEDLVARLKGLGDIGADAQALLIDSIALEAQDRAATAKREREIAHHVNEGLAWLVPFTAMSAEALRERLTAAAEAKNLTAAREAAEAARAWAEAEGKRLDGARIRAALLRELVELGYEVSQQGDGWSESSRITAQKPSEPNYDVQLSAAPGGAIQSKVRAYSHPGRSAGINRRDVEVEQSWCDDLAKLNARLAEQGIGADMAFIEPPGAQEQLPLPARNADAGRDGAAVRGHMQKGS